MLSIKPKHLFYFGIAFYIFYGAYLSGAQYYVWSHDTFSQQLLREPLNAAVPIPYIITFLRPLFLSTHGYFTYYVLGRFWFEIVMLLASTIIIFLVFWSLRMWKNDLYDEDFLYIVVLSALMAGWPHIFVFLPLLAFGLLLHTLSIAVYKKYILPVLWVPIICGMVALLGGGFFLNFLHISL